MMKIMRASAGSGKTYNLTRTYIEILLKSQDRYAYRHILAVTFTNKATAEMKSRILKELHTLAFNTHQSDYLAYFVPDVISTESLLQKKAESILVDILHDYSAFSISTIDKFFQQTLKAFSREIGHFSSYQVELDKKSLVHESVDRILDSLTEDQTGLIKWLNDGVMNQLRQGNRLNLERDLYDMAEKLKSDEYREQAEKYSVDAHSMFTSERLAVIRRECEDVVSAFPARVKQAALAVKDAMASVSVSPDDTNRKFLSKIVEYAFLEGTDDVKAPSEAVMSKARDKDSWFANSKKKLLKDVDGVLDEPLKDFCDLFDTPFKVYGTARLLLEQTFSLGVASDFYREFDALMKEKNVLGIDDTNTILKGIIDGCDAPFIYEKLGVRFENFLLDEFQDTSTIQWQNFFPLLNESEGNNNSNLVVGDVKQSIYRWRGSDWDLLASRLPASFRDADVVTLQSNYRSASNVVGFNNSFFRYAADTMALSDIYKDVIQECKSSDAQSGEVRLTFCREEDEQSVILESIEAVMAAGARYGDIAVLVRNNKEGGDTASFLIDKGIPVISDDSLFLKSSTTIRRLFSLLSYVENPQDKVNAYLVDSLDITVPERYRSLVDLCESLLRSLKEKDEMHFNGDILYVQSFMDVLQEWCTKNGQNLLQFLKYWDDASPKLSSPADLDSVRIMTVHKSKGLEFPHVILPYLEKVDLYGGSYHWCKPGEIPEELKSDMDNPLSVASEGIYPVNLSSKAKNSLFSADYEREHELQAVDGLNLLYVALTRPEKSLHVISKVPSSSFLKVVDKYVKSPDTESFPVKEMKDYSQLLYAYVTRHVANPPMIQLATRAEEALDLDEENADPRVDYVVGEPYDFTKIRRKKEVRQETFDASYESIPLAGRLKLSEEAVDFFSDDGRAGLDASPRIKGVVLHDILSKVIVPADLDNAVSDAVRDGLLSAEEGHRVGEMLAERIANAVKRGWFPQDGEVSNETTLIGADGEIQRPDRVVTTQQGTVVIDYKFGADRPEKHIYQVRRYVRLYKAMGYSDVTGYLWYVQDDEVVKV